MARKRRFKFKPDTRLYPASVGPVTLRRPTLTSAERKAGRNAVAGYHERQRALAAAPHVAAKRERARLSWIVWSTSPQSTDRVSWLKLCLDSFGNRLEREAPTFPAAEPVGDGTAN